jgi:hypothetical protein
VFVDAETRVSIKIYNKALSFTQYNAEVQHLYIVGNFITRITPDRADKFRNYNIQTREHDHTS